MSYNVLFVCTGNTCRSPMAEALTRHAAGERGWSGLEVRSAGAAALDGLPASEEVPRVLDEAGIPMHDHASSPLSAELVQWADAILVMGPGHTESVRALGGGDKVALITRYLDGPEADSPVRDPIGGGVELYRETRDQLRRSIDAFLDRIEPIVAPSR